MLSNFGSACDKKSNGNSKSNNHGDQECIKATLRGIKAKAQLRVRLGVNNVGSDCERKSTRTRHVHAGGWRVLDAACKDLANSARCIAGGGFTMHSQCIHTFFTHSKHVSYRVVLWTSVVGLLPLRRQSNACFCNQLRCRFADHRTSPPRHRSKGGSQAGSAL